MGANVFANGREVSAEKSDDQSIAAMPDVCLSPPAPPAGPLPLPYPNFSKASDMADGTKTVVVGGGQAGMKDQSNYKSSKGDEAATRSFGMGVVSHTIQEKTFFAAWSSDVMFEGANAVRFMDMTTHNHSNPTNGARTVSTGKPKPAVFTQSQCDELSEKNKKKRKALKRNKRKTVRQVGSESTTITHGIYQLPNGTSGTLKACSRALVRKYDNGLVEGLTAKKVSKGKTNMCPEAKFKYARTARPLTSHTESRILEHLMGNPTSAGPGTSVLMSINWKKGRTISDEPCDHCADLICSAVKNCGFVIKLCQGDPASPQNPECPET